MKSMNGVNKRLAEATSPLNVSRVMNTAQYRSSDSLLVATDCIIFGFDGKQLKALLITLLRADG